MARQVVSHGHVLVDGKKVDIPSYRVIENDIIEVAPKSQELTPFIVARAEAGERTPPEATTGWALRPRADRRPSTSGPPSMPSRSMAVTTTAPSSRPATASRASSSVVEVDSSQPRTASVAPARRWSRPTATRPGYRPAKVARAMLASGA